MCLPNAGPLRKAPVASGARPHERRRRLHASFAPAPAPPVRMEGESGITKPVSLLKSVAASAACLVPPAATTFGVVQTWQRNGCIYSTGTPPPSFALNPQTGATLSIATTCRIIPYWGNLPDFPGHKRSALFSKFLIQVNQILKPLRPLRSPSHGMSPCSNKNRRRSYVPKSQTRIRVLPRPP
jgi:hypothetical protein